MRPGAVLTEVVVQGIRRFGDVRRFTFAPGYNVFYGLSAAGKSTLREVLLSLLFSLPEEGEEERFRSSLPQGKSACRAGMTLTMGGETFRVLKDYQQGSVTLSRLNPEKKFELVFSDAGPIRRWLSDHARLTVGPPFGQLFSLTRDDLPSTLDAKTGGVRLNALDSDFEQKLLTMSLGEKRTLLEKFADEFRRQAEMKTTEFLQDGLRTKLFEVEALLKRREEATTALAEADAELAPIAKVPKLPDHFTDKLEAYKRMEKTREGELGELTGRQEQAHAELAALIPSPYTEKDFRALRSPQDMVKTVLTKDFIVDGGIALFLVGFILAAFFRRPLNLGGVLFLLGGAGLIVWRGLLVFLKAKEGFDSLRRSVDQADEQVRVLEKKWDIETTYIRNLMKAYSVEDPEEMIEIDKNRDELSAKRARLAAALAAIVHPSGDKDFDGMKNRYTKQIADLDKRLGEISGDFTTDPKDLEPQIERLDREVSRAEGRRPASRAKLFGREEDMADANMDVGAGMTSLVEAWCGSRKADSGKFLRAIQEAYGKNLRAISGGRYSDASFDAAGTVRVREDGKQPLPYEMLDSIGKDAAYLALRLTILQLESRGTTARLITVLDDPFEYEEGRLMLLSRAFKALGTEAQVIHLTSRPVHRKLADLSAEI